MHYYILVNKSGHYWAYGHWNPDIEQVHRYVILEDAHRAAEQFCFPVTIENVDDKAIAARREEAK